MSTRKADRQMSRTITIPDEMDDRLNQIHQSDSFVLEAIDEAINRYTTALTEKKAKQNKILSWVEDAQKSSPLTGYQDEIERLSKEFREGFSFKHDEE